jgi:hypothetical protein
MKIKEAIEELNKFDPELELVIQDSEMLFYEQVKKFKVEEKHFVDYGKAKNYFDTDIEAKRCNKRWKLKSGKEKVLIVRVYED